ncbi:APA family basic amino acid/polyamine antiporter [Catalinimonas alkaloidigena]|uniref:APC family permease n=1 Tax=Catalinimonas alkaloidigena TaxID=1075417 RepID=UPI0024052B2F|nr:APC family permease [Catalinimonas alkaloidigena]MDF9800822.1 APA family basic amino acid/polyamine antiporter [Catalinimonas alkaloidigena]
MISTSQSKTKTNGLVRKMGLLGLAATGICSMLGASINVVPFMIQRNVPGIGPYVLPAFLFAAIPAIFAAFAYSILASAMPRAGGSYIYASRGLNPYLGFVASFSQWFGLSIVIGVVSYVIIPFIRDVAVSMNWQEMAVLLDKGWIRVSLAIFLLWIFVGINIRGAKSYERTLIPLMFLMFALGAIVIVAGFIFDQQDFAAGLLAKEGRVHEAAASPAFSLDTFLAASALLFSSFIGFDSIAQAGGEAKNPSRTLPLAIALAIIVVGSFYFLFTAAVYHTVPWSFIAEEVMQKDITAPGMLSYVLPSSLAVAIVAGAAIALINDLPAMLLSVSRLMFAWAEDGIFPKKIAKVHSRRHTPHIALIVSGIMASIGILGSHFAGDFFLGIDIMVTSMMVNFLLMCITLLRLPHVNPDLAEKVTVIRKRSMQQFLGWMGTLMLSGFLIIHSWKDLNSEAEAWYFHSTPIWLIVMSLASIIFFVKLAALKKQGVDTRQLFTKLPPE